jgi:hypothetical protein
MKRKKTRYLSLKMFFLYGYIFCYINIWNSMIFQGSNDLKKKIKNHSYKKKCSIHDIPDVQSHRGLEKDQ